MFGKDDSSSTSSAPVGEIVDDTVSSNVMKPAANNIEDDWNAVPAFLRRSKGR